MPDYAAEFEHPDLSRGQIGEALEALLAAPDFALSGRNKRFLRYVVEECLAGRADLLKAYVIATNAFGRGKSFDPETDPIVRIEATRLRAALDHYYATHAGRLRVRIRLPKGAYVPTFEALPQPEYPAAALVSPGATLPAADRSRWRLSGPAWTVAAIALLGLAVAFRAFDRAAPAEISEKPLLVVQILDSVDAQPLSHAFRDRLSAALVRFERWTVQDGDGGSSPPRAPGGLRNTYQLSLRRNGLGLTWRLVDRADGEIVGSDMIVVRPGEWDEAEPQIIADLADQLGGSRGSVNAAEQSRQSARPTLGHGCIASLETEIWIWDRRDRLPAVRDCLERTLSIRPNDPEIMAALARALMRMTPFEGGKETIERAYGLAARSLVLSPYSSQSALALLIALVRKEDFAGAADVGLRALALNPADRTIRVYVGIALLTAGRLDEGIGLIKAAESPHSLSLPDAQIFLAFVAFKSKDYQDAIRRTDMVLGVKCFCLMALRAAAYAEIGDMDQARAEVARLLESRPDVATSYTRAMATRGIVSAFREPIRAGLLKAGLAVR